MILYNKINRPKKTNKWNMNEGHRNNRESGKKEINYSSINFNISKLLAPKASLTLISEKCQDMRIECGQSAVVYMFGY